MKVIILPQAQEDLDGITEPLLTRLRRQILALADYPEIGAPMGGRHSAYRSFVVEFYRVVYRISGEVVMVNYVRDCRRKPLQ